MGLKQDRKWLEKLQKKTKDLSDEIWELSWEFAHEGFHVLAQEAESLSIDLLKMHDEILLVLADIKTGKIV